jgi:hypothetical protein
MIEEGKLTLIASGIAKGPIVQAVQRVGGARVSVQTMSDIQGAQYVKQGKADYFIGSCTTGQGGALSMAIAVLGKDRCVMLTDRGKMLPVAQIREKAAGPYLAFGLNADQAEKAAGALVQALLEKHHLAEPRK